MPFSGAAVPSLCRCAGGGIALLLLSTVALGWPLARSLPRSDAARPQPSRRGFWLAALVPAIITTAGPGPFRSAFSSGLGRGLPLRCIWLFTGRSACSFAGDSACCVASFRRVLSGSQGLSRRSALRCSAGVLDRYVASFVPHAGRVPCDCWAGPWGSALSAGGRDPQRGGTRTALARACAAIGVFSARLRWPWRLISKGCSSLSSILPVIVLFFLLFGTMGGWVGRRTGLPAAGGIGLGLVLAWSIGVSFPMFQANVLIRSRKETGPPIRKLSNAGYMRRCLWRPLLLLVRVEGL